jgi:hypothetical protein
MMTSGDSVSIRALVADAGEAGIGVAKALDEVRLFQ